MKRKGKNITELETALDKSLKKLLFGIEDPLLKGEDFENLWYDDLDGLSKEARRKWNLLTKSLDQLDKIYRSLHDELK